MIKATLIACLIPATGVLGSSLLALLSPDICLCLFGGPPQGQERYVALALLVLPMAMMLVLVEYGIHRGTGQLCRAGVPTHTPRG